MLQPPKKIFKLFWTLDSGCPGSPANFKTMSMAMPSNYGAPPPTRAGKSPCPDLRQLVRTQTTATAAVGEIGGEVGGVLARAFVRPLSGVPPSITPAITLQHIAKKDLTK
jgi:hypothetical protein